MTDAWATPAGGRREVYAVAEDGTGLQQITFCATPCDHIAVAPAPDRRRVAVARVAADRNGDGTLTADDGAALLIVDLSRSVEGTLIPAATRVSGVDWSPSPTGDVLVYAANGQGGIEDLFRSDAAVGADGLALNNVNLTTTATVRERHPRIDPSGSIAVFERIEAGGKAEVWVFESTVQQSKLTSGGSGTDPLPGTPYLIGSDADPDIAPDSSAIVFRRLTGRGSGSGTWDVVTALSDGSRESVIAGGPAWRSAPDWGPRGITFAERDDSGTRLVVVQPDGSGRKVLVNLGSSYTIDSPRWLP